MKEHDRNNYNIQFFPSFLRPDSHEYVWVDMNSDGKDSFNLLPGEKVRSKRDGLTNLSRFYQELTDLQQTTTQYEHRL